MKRITFYALVFLMSFTINPIQAQEKATSEKIEILEKEREAIISEEKEALKKEVERINLRYEKKEINWEEAEELKSEAAKRHARNIQERTAEIDRQLAELRGEVGEHDEWEEEEEDDDWYHKSRYSRTTTHLVLAAGFNNALLEGQSLNDSDFKVGGSRFFEIGLAWRTRVFEQTNWLRFRYGFSFQLNGLKPTDNRYFVQNGDLIELQEYPLDLDKSKFRMDNLVFPVHFEFGPSEKIESERSVWYSTRNKIKVGLGGYAGFNLGERQKLRFEEDGENVKNKLKGDYNTNDFIYGLSGYLGWGAAALYVKYDLNPIFDDPNPELHNISIGLRFDVN
jgi:hypothetical protein